MDGFETNEGVIIIAATNRPDVLDPALMRPGRFDRQVYISNPDIIGREQILKVHMKKIKMSKNINSRTIARGTPGFSGADLANLVNEAALIAARKNQRMVTSEEFEEAKDKVYLGAERRSKVITEEDKKLTAYHEAGHAIAGIHSPKCDPLHKVTIIPRGRAGGVTWFLPEHDKDYRRMDELKDEMVMALGGRIAEEIIFGKDKISSGAQSDIKGITKSARRMVTQWGMSEKLGTLLYDNDSEEIFLGHSVTQSKNLSNSTADIIDKEVKSLVDEATKKCNNILNENIKELHFFVASSTRLFTSLSMISAVEFDKFLDCVTECPRKISSLSLSYNKVPNFSLIPHCVTILLALLVIPLISLCAPLEILSFPNMISSAILPPKAITISSLSSSILL
jgi:cell division protease FtsH